MNPKITQDGVRVRASAGAASFRRCSTLKECRRQAEEHVARLRAVSCESPRFVLIILSRPPHNPPEGVS